MPKISSFQSVCFNQFDSSPTAPILGLDSMILWGKNILTLGIYTTVTTLEQKHVVRRLELQQENLQERIEHLRNRWDQLEGECTSLLNQLHNLSQIKGSFDSLKKKMMQLQNGWNDVCEENQPFHNHKLVTSVTDIALGIIVFVGNLVANILTLGIYGVYAHQLCKNRIQSLCAQNESMQQQLIDQREEKANHLQAMMDNLSHSIAIYNTEPARAYIAYQQVQNEFAALQEKQNQLNQEIIALKAIRESDKKKSEEEVSRSRSEMQALRQRTNLLEATNLRLEQEKLRISRDLDEATKNLKRLQDQYSQVKAKAEKVQGLERQISGLQATQQHQSDIIKLASSLGMNPPRYLPRAEDKKIFGAMDIAENEQHLPPLEVLFAKLYNKRYGEKRSASEIIVASFNDACEWLFEMADKGDKIKLNRSGETIATFGKFAIYRLMALDLVRGGRVTENSCGGFKLDINEHVYMLPSHSENVLRYKPDVKDGIKPCIEFRYRQRDDFTPDENALRLRDGVNAVAVKWILTQLSDEEKEFLFTHLIAPIIENHHIDYVSMLTFMQNRHNPRVQLVEKASLLIQDLATAFEKKFEQTVLVPCYQEHFNDWNIKPFVKPEDDLTELNKIPDITPISVRTKIVNWELDEDVLGDKREGDRAPRQKEFFSLIKTTRDKLQCLSPYIGPSLLKNSQTPGKEFQKLTWNEVNAQYFVSHQMIGANFHGYGGERCLFSNLLAILVTDSKDLNSENVKKLKNAMAAYLDKLQKANVQWSRHSERNKAIDMLSEEASKIKELAELAQNFERVISDTYKCTVKQYQGWLRNDPFNQPSMPITLDALTPLEIQLAAFTVGIRIGILSINMDKSLSKVDQSGRILPKGQFYGPHTEELSLMGFASSLNGGGTYYGLFPRLDITGNEDLLEDPSATDAAIDLENYWGAIQMNKIS